MQSTDLKAKCESRRGDQSERKVVDAQREKLLLNAAIAKAKGEVSWLRTLQRFSFVILNYRRLDSSCSVNFFSFQPSL